MGDPKSSFVLEPICAATLAENETARRDALLRLGLVRTGCAEIDNEALLGGFERGSVCGISAEEDDFGMLVRKKELPRPSFYTGCLC